MLKVVTLSGIPGSGKSRHAEMLVKEHAAKGNTIRDSWEIVSADDFFMVPNRLHLHRVHHDPFPWEEASVYKFDPEKLSDAHASCFRRFIAAMTDRLELIIVDNTNMSVWEASPYMLGAQAFGYEAEFVRVLCNTELAASRNTHGVSKETVYKMHDRMEAPLPWWNTTVIHNQL